MDNQNNCKAQRDYTFINKKWIDSAVNFKAHSSFKELSEVDMLLNKETERNHLCCIAWLWLILLLKAEHMYKGLICTLIRICIDLNFDLLSDVDEYFS